MVRSSAFRRFFCELPAKAGTTNQASTDAVGNLTIKALKVGETTYCPQPRGVGQGIADKQAACGFVGKNDEIPVASEMAIIPRDVFEWCKVRGVLNNPSSIRIWTETTSQIVILSVAKDLGTLGPDPSLRSE